MFTSVVCKHCFVMWCTCAWYSHLYHGIPTFIICYRSELADKNFS